MGSGTKDKSCYIQAGKVDVVWVYKSAVYKTILLFGSTGGPQVSFSASPQAKSEIAMQCLIFKCWNPIAIFQYHNLGKQTILWVIVFCALWFVTNGPGKVVFSSLHPDSLAEL